MPDEPRVFAHPDNPEPAAVVHDVTEMFHAHGITNYLVYGGIISDHIVLGDTARTGDVDIIISMDDWCKLPVEFKHQFQMHRPHIRYLRRLRAAGTLHRTENGRKIVLPQPALVVNSTADLTEKYGLPIGISITPGAIDPVHQCLDADFGIRQACFDGQTTWVSNGFMADHMEQTFTYRRSKTRRMLNLDIPKAFGRWKRFQDRYPGWRWVLPEEYWPYYAIIT